MDIDLGGISVEKLLEEFGAGNHIPGSGSAAALQSLISAQLILTVIKITLEPDRKAKYGKVWREMLEFKQKIEEDYIPALHDFFHEDYQIFDRVIINRRARDSYKLLRDEGTSEKFIEAKNEIEKDLYMATKSAMEISKVANELANIGLKVFDKGYKAVRGDSSVAIHGLLAMVIGGLNIAEVNLRSLVEHENFKDLETELEKVRSDYQKTIEEANEKLSQLQKAIKKKKEYCYRIAKILSVADKGEIEKAVRALQWELFSESENQDFSSVSTAKKAFEFLGYEVIKETSLGAFDDFGGRVEAAGEVDNAKKIVRISTKFLPPVQRFTLAHELGHAILHHKSIATLHRDRGLDSGVIHPKRPSIEVEADKFAAFFLMPRKEMINQFKVRFGSEKLQIDQNFAFSLLSAGIVELKKKFKIKRNLSKYIAKETFFAGQPFTSMADQFQVSIEAMAIRIEELELIDFSSIGY